MISSSRFARYATTLLQIVKRVFWEASKQLFFRRTGSITKVSLYLKKKKKSYHKKNIYISFSWFSRFGSQKAVGKYDRKYKYFFGKWFYFFPRALTILKKKKKKSRKERMFPSTPFTSRPSTFSHVVNICFV